MELLNVKEAAKILKISEWTLRRHLRKGKLPGYKMSFGWRMDREALEEYLHNKTNTTSYHQRRE